MGGEFYIWSIQHNAWWRPDESGYCLSLRAAGRYSKDRAIEICRHTRNGARHDLHTEIPVPVDVMNVVHAEDIALLAATHELTPRLEGKDARAP